MVGRGYEYMDLEPTAIASDRAAGPAGFAGSAAHQSGTKPAGLATLTGHHFGGDSTAPMLPTTWTPDLD